MGIGSIPELGRDGFASVCRLIDALGSSFSHFEAVIGSDYVGGKSTSTDFATVQAVAEDLEHQDVSDWEWPPKRIALTVPPLVSATSYLTLPQKHPPAGIMIDWMKGSWVVVGLDESREEEN